MSTCVPAHQARPVPHVIGIAVNERFLVTHVRVVQVTHVYEINSTTSPAYIVIRQEVAVGATAKTTEVAVVDSAVARVVRKAD